MSPPAFLASHWQFFAPLLWPALGWLQARLGRWPVLQVVVKHLGGWPAIKHVLVEIARVVVAEWGNPQSAPAPALPPELAPLAQHLTPEEQAVLAGAGPGK